GPGRRRLPRSAYLAEQEMAKRMAETMRKVEIELAELERLRVEAVMNAGARERAEILENENRTLNARNFELTRKVSQLEDWVRRVADQRDLFRDRARETLETIMVLVSYVMNPKFEAKKYLLSSPAPFQFGEELWQKFKDFLIRDSN
ncbi:unnamed protein product, partial [Phaeothamnion confervicola]